MKQNTTISNTSCPDFKPKAIIVALLSLLIWFLPLETNAQRTMNISGGTASVGGNTFSYSIGEMVLVQTVSTPNLIVTQGLLQSKVVNLGTEENALLAEGLSLYPNPTADILYLQPNLKGGGKMVLKLFDLRGRLVMQEKAHLKTGTERQELNLVSLQEGTYLLRASLQQDGRNYEHSFKILKTGIR